MAELYRTLRTTTNTMMLSRVSAVYVLLSFFCYWNSGFISFINYMKSCYLRGLLTIKSILNE